MTIDEFLDPANVHVGLRASHKERLLHDLSRLAGSALSLPSTSIVKPLLDREELGSTGMGDGVAIPHARLAGIERPFGLFATLKSPIDFQSVDGRPVDLVFLMLLPAGSTGRNLCELATVARRLRRIEVATALRRTRGALDAFALVVERP